MTKTIDRRTQNRAPQERWHSALTEISPNKILIRGYPLDEMMGRLGFAEAVYLLLMGELPTPAIGRMLNAVLVSSVDHGVMPPSTLAARNVATSGAPLKDCVAAGILAFGPHHGGDIESCMRFLDGGLTLVRAGKSVPEAAEAIVADCVKLGEPPPGFGHRLHTRDPRAARLFQMALELEAEGPHVQMIRAVELVMSDLPDGHAQPVNIDGAIAAVCGDIGIPPETANALFIISRVPGIAAQAQEERAREHPMRQIDPKDHVYDGTAQRRLPDKRR